LRAKPYLVEKKLRNRSKKRSQAFSWFCSANLKQTLKFAASRPKNSFGAHRFVAILVTIASQDALQEREGDGLRR
jgi:hypothetical protein